MSKLSPGPWTVQPLQATHGADMAIVAADGAIVTVIEHDPAIQTEEEPDGETVVWSETDRANATALAALPDLLKALKALRNECASTPRPDRLISLIAAADIAIASATVGDARR